MKVLIVKIGLLGDVVTALPMISAVRALDPAATITWLCGQAVAPLLRAVEGVDELLVVDERRLLAGTPLERVSELARVWYRLLGRRFDLVASGTRDFRYELLSLTARAGARRSFRRHSGRPGFIAGRYRGDEHARLVTNLDGVQAQRFGFPPVRLDLPAKLALRLKDLPRPAIAIAPGGAKNFVRDTAAAGSLRPLARWPLESYVLLAQRLLERAWGVVLTGAESDHWVSSAFDHLPVLNMIGETSVTDLLALYGRCEAVVTHDSGPLHIAVLAGTRLVALFGPTNPEEVAPPSRNIRALWNGNQLACSPCYDGRDYAPCEDNVCMRSISVEAVLRALDGLLDTQA
jgi:heptosyltransferase II